MTKRDFATIATALHSVRPGLYAGDVAAYRVWNAATDAIADALASEYGRKFSPADFWNVATGEFQP